MSIPCTCSIYTCQTLLLKPIALTMAGKKSSPLWLFFVEAENSKYAICQVCKTSVSHGGKIFNTSNLEYHLKSKHKEEYPQYEERKGTPGDKPKVTTYSTCSCKQLSLTFGILTIPTQSASTRELLR